MKTKALLVLLSGLILMLSGCGKSAQEKLAEKQLKAVEDYQAAQVEAEKQKAAMKKAADAIK
jgi:protein involved in sex pheromone biosynthesis